MSDFKYRLSNKGGKMQDKIFMKTSSGGIWETNTTLAFGILIFLSSVAYILLSILLNLSVFIGFTIYIIFMVSLISHMNQKHNMSKSTAFIKRDGEWYAIQLLYSNNVPVTEKSVKSITNVDKFERAIVVQAHEKEVRTRREDVTAFTQGLDDILELYKGKKKYKVKSDKEKSMMDKWFYGIVNNGMIGVSTKKGNYNFLHLKNPRIIKESKENFALSFENQNGDICSAKFSNCFGDFLREIK